MPAGYYRCQVTIPTDSGIPADSVVNVFSFQNEESAASASDDAVAIVARLDGFYTAIASILSSQLTWAAATVKVYNYVDFQPRVPILEAPLGAAEAGVTWSDFPPEVALCLSFKAQAISGANARRRRGRVYLGPIQSTSTTDFNAVMAGHITTVMSAAATHLAFSGADPRKWAIYSPSTHRGVPVGGDINAELPNGDPLYPEDPARLGQSFQDVHTYWMDNAWDTQRRRGVKATSRTTALAP